MNRLKLIVVGIILLLTTIACDCDPNDRAKDPCQAAIVTPIKAAVTWLQVYQ